MKFIFFFVFLSFLAFVAKIADCSGLVSRDSKCPYQTNHFFDGLFHAGQHRTRNQTVADAEFINFSKAPECLDRFIAKAMPGFNIEIELVRQFDGVQYF